MRECLAAGARGDVSIKRRHVWALEPKECSHKNMHNTSGAHMSRTQFSIVIKLHNS